ncbi:MAG: type VI secretion system baseplate subunit TssF [Ginsengibacter sp.]
MLLEINSSKEVIRNRMLKHALNYWSIKNAEDLDPIVKLILEALSNELFNLGNDIKDTEVRLLEKIANMLAPEFLICPHPAHAILHAAPVEAEEVLKETNQFYTQKKISSKQDETLDKSIDVFFTAVDKVRLFNAEISYTFSGSSLFAYDASFNKQIVAQTVNGHRIENNVIWIGLTIDDTINDINKLFFYFDWKNLEHELSNLNYQLLPLSKWYINDEEVNTKEGVPYEEKQGNDLNQRKSVLDRETLSLLEQDIKNYYERKFIAVDDSRFKKFQGLKVAYPSSFQNIFKEQDLKKITTKLLWLKVVFPAALPQGSLDEVFVYTNSFPIMNRQLIDLKYRLKGGSNIIPLKTTGLEQFLSVRSLSDESHQFTATPFRKMEEEETGTYTIRKGGIERFDGRNAKEFISYLLELLRSESAAFSAYGNDFIASTLREMDQRIALMEQKTKAVANRVSEIPHYIIAKPYDGNKMIYAEYWTTLAELPNGLRSGTRLNEYNGVRVKSESLLLLTTTSGGKNNLKPEERVNAFKYGLMTRNRIVTKQDIRNLCFYELGSRISNISIDNGFDMSPHPQQGFMRTIDITITPSSAEKLDKEGWQVLFDQLKSKLQSRSGMSNHYRIFLRK